MNYQEFLCATIYRITKEYGDMVDVDVYETLKNNGNLRKGIIIREKEKNIGPVIYMEEFFDRFNNGISLESVVKDVMLFYRKIRCPSNLNCDNILEFDKVQDKIAVKLINYKKNKDYLKDYPHVRMLDLAIVFYIVLEVCQDGLATVVITYEHMKKWGISESKLYDIALKNSVKLLPAKFTSMKDMLEELMYDSSESEPVESAWTEGMMYVLTNEQRNCGAACMLYGGILDMIGNLLGSNFFILPSSIHEVLIVAADDFSDPDILDSIINDVNHSYVAKEELLGNHCYIYDRLTKQIRFGHEWKKPN